MVELALVEVRIEPLSLNNFSDRFCFAVGSVTGKFGFDTFTHERASIDSPPM